MADASPWLFLVDVDEYAYAKHNAGIIGSPSTDIEMARRVACSFISRSRLRGWQNPGSSGFQSGQWAFFRVFKVIFGRKQNHSGKLSSIPFSERVELFLPSTL